MKKMLSVFILTIFLTISFLYIAPSGSNKVFATNNCAPGACNSTCCNDSLSGPMCNGTSCRTQGNYCSAGSCVYGWAGGGAASGCLNNCQPTPTPVPGCTSNSQCAYCEFCSSGSCVPYTGGCPIGGATPTPVPVGSCPAGQNAPFTQCQGTTSGGSTSYSCISSLGCGVNQCSTAAECGATYCPPPACTPTTSCSAQSRTCGTIYNGCSTVSCGTCGVGQTCSSSGTCIAATPTPTPISGGSGTGNVFVTSTTYNGNLGGLAGADSKCQTRASAAGLSGTWKAWISDDTTSATSRLLHSTSPYYRMDGALIANNWTDLTDGTLAAPINRTEFNTAAPTNPIISGGGLISVMTDTNPDGSIKAAGQSCNNWTSSLAAASGGYAFYGGDGTKSTSLWTYAFQATCDPAAVGTHSLYCFRQGAPSTPTPTPTSAPSTYSISGTVYLDTVIRNGAQDSGEVGYSGAGIRITNGVAADTRISDTNGNYSFTSLSSGTWTDTLTVPAGYVATTANPRTVSLGPNTTINFGIAPAVTSTPTLTPSPTPIPLSTGTIFVYNDLDGNGAQDSGENGLPNITVNVTGIGAGSYKTSLSGTVTLTGLPSGTSTITGVAPTGYVSTTTNPVTTSWPPSQTINIGMHPFPPTCTGLTANPTTVNPGQSSTLTVSGCPAGVTYTWPVPDYGTTVNVNNPVTTWNSPNPFYQDVFSHPSVRVCFPISGVCSNYGTQIHIIPLFTIAGNVFVDVNKDAVKNVGENNYSGGITITSSGGTVTYPTSGAYNVRVTAGTYTISYTSLPVGYEMTNPLDPLPPPSFNVTIGNPGCSPAANCDANGNITNLNFGITNSIPWIQSRGGDITGTNISDPSGGGFEDPIPAGATCGTYASVTGGGGFPGMIYSGAGSSNFGQGQASQNPYNWVVGGPPGSYPETYTPSTPGVIRTSYNYINSIASQSNLTPTPLGATQCGLGGTNDCHLVSSLPSGLYSAGNLNLTGSSVNFALDRDIVILVNGTLNINTEVHVPIGSSLFFTVSGDIHVGNNVGESVITSTRSNVEGYYSADKNFYVDGTNTCPTSDLRLNVAGAVVVNAALSGGDFINNRDLCAGDLQCPVFQIQERPDFVLNSPDFFKNARRVWQEIAP